MNENYQVITSKFQGTLKLEKTGNWEFSCGEVVDINSWHWASGFNNGLEQSIVIHFDLAAKHLKIVYGHGTVDIYDRIEDIPFEKNISLKIVVGKYGKYTIWKVWKCTQKIKNFRALKQSADYIFSDYIFLLAILYFAEEMNGFIGCFTFSELRIGNRLIPPPSVKEQSDYVFVDCNSPCANRNCNKVCFNLVKIYKEHWT